MARMRGPEGREESCEAGYIAGCDGVRSTARETIGTNFPGGTYRQLFYVADVEAAGPPVNGELNADLDEADILAVFPLAGKGRARLIGSVRDERADRADTLKFEDCPNDGGYAGIISLRSSFYKAGIARALSKKL
jgi:2-polyprenyl-6-methoxyphenol hydroxylase-like FAD-dependent oxidoreductase